MNLIKSGGVKDPCACLFLDEWHQTLGDSGYYLFIVCHWSGCIESLLNRHSRDLVYSLKPMQTNLGSRFWSDPALLAKMWLTYSERLIQFIKKHSQRTLLLTQRALFSGVSLIQRLNQNFDFHLDKSTPSTFQKTLFNYQVCESILDLIPESLQDRLNQVWLEMLSLAVFREQDESPIYYSQTLLNVSLFQQYQQNINELPFKGGA